MIVMEMVDIVRRVKNKEKRIQQENQLMEI
jgi:hypothetical protein